VGELLPGEVVEEAEVVICLQGDLMRLRRRT